MEIERPSIKFRISQQMGLLGNFEICYFAKLQIWDSLLIKMCSKVKTLNQRPLLESQIIFVLKSKFWLLCTFSLIKCVKFAIFQNRKFQSCLAAPSVEIFKILLMGVQFPSFLSKMTYQSFKVISEKLLKWFFKKRLQNPKKQQICPKVALWCVQSKFF